MTTSWSQSIRQTEPFRFFFWEWEPDDWAPGTNISFDISKNVSNWIHLFFDGKTEAIPSITITSFAYQSDVVAESIVGRRWTPPSVQRHSSNGKRGTKGGAHTGTSWTPLFPLINNIWVSFFTYPKSIESHHFSGLFCPAAALPHWPDLEADGNPLPPARIDVDDLQSFVTLYRDRCEVHNQTKNFWPLASFYVVALLISTIWSHPFLVC
jgi:hypothetical protein